MTATPLTALNRVIFCVQPGVRRLATITTPHAGWTGSETITFRAADPDGLWDDDPAAFTVTQAPWTQSLPLVAGVAFLNRLLLSERLESTKDLRQAAATLKTDMLLIYSIDTSFNVENTDVGPLGIITLGFLPTKNARVTATASAGAAGSPRASCCTSSRSPRTAESGRLDVMPLPRQTRSGTIA